MHLSPDREAYYLDQMRALASGFAQFTALLPKARDLVPQVGEDALAKEEVFLKHGDAIVEEMRREGVAEHWSRLAEKSGMQQQMAVAVAALG
jgi:hypothetical protein